VKRKNFKIKSYCKINLLLKVTKRLKNGYHNIASLITFCDIYDVISISKSGKAKDKISISGKFKKGINKNSNTATKTLNLLRKNKLLSNESYKIKIQKNIPHGSGLGGGSSNAASLLNYLKPQMNLKLNKSKMEKLASKIGFDVPICLEKKNTFLIGKKEKMLRIKKKFKFNILIVYPNLVCSTEKIYKKNKKITLLKKGLNFNILSKEKLINYLKNERNDLENTVLKIYPKIKNVIKVIKLQKGCYFSRISGSGSACIGIFSNMENAIYAKKLIKLKYPNYWCVVSKTI